MATADFAFWSTDVVKAHVGATTDGQDALLERIANSVSLTFERRCRRRFVLRESVELVDGTGTSRLLLPEYPVTEVDQIRIYRYVGQVTPDELVLGDGYARVLGDRGEVLLAQDSFTKGVGNVEVTYTAGYFAQDEGHESAAAQVYAAALDLVQLLFQEKATGGLGMSNLTIGPMGFAIKPEWPKHIHQAFADWRRVRL
jgi:hypothetical protein